MLRLLLIEAALFGAPFALYFLWRFFADRKRADRGRFRRRPWPALVIAGGALMLAGLLLMARGEGGEGNMIYIPAYTVDGRVVPGRYVPADEAGDLARMDPKERAEAAARRDAAP